MKTRHATPLEHAGSGPALALAAEAGAPECVQLMPAGPEISGRDGRQFRMSDPSRLVAAFAANRAPLPIDWEHAQDLAAPKGEEAPAAAWIEEVAARDDGTVWGRVDWTARGGAAVASKEYRFLSPTFLFDRSTGEVIALKGAGLVNRPNFVMASLNRQEDPPMLNKLLAALGLAETATEAEALAAIGVALNRAQATPDLATYVPRADYDAALNRAVTAEATLATRDHAAREAEIAREVEAAVTAGKITPATKGFYLATCRQEGGLEQFRAFVAAQPSAFTPTKTVEPDNKAAALNAEEKQACLAMGIAEADYLKTKGA